MKLLHRGAYAAAWGPFIITYGPLYRQEHPFVQESIRYHEYIHVTQWGWGFRDLYDRIGGKKYSSREIEAYLKQKEYIENKLKDPSISEEAREALEEMKDDVEWMLEHPEYM